MLQGKRATVVGLAREGLDLVRFLARVGARVHVTDQKPAAQLHDERMRLAGVEATYRFGGHAPEDVAGADVVFASPGVPPEHGLLQEARRRGVPVSSLVQLFFELCPAPIVGITGSAGKTTTTSLAGEIFRAAGRDVFVGGNIGRPLLGELDRITPASWVVLELSSFQLEPLRRSPQVAVVTNVTANHLDRHPSMEAYWEAKGHILAHQGPADWAVLNADDVWASRYQPRGRALHFSLERRVHGAYLDGDRLMLHERPLLTVADIPLRGRHNLANVLAAAAAASAAGVESESIAAATRVFRGVPHRLQLVLEREGVRFYDDSIATAPERSIAALRAFDEPVVLLAGGRDKHLPMHEWARLIVARARHVVLLGEMSDLVADAIRQADPAYAAVSRAGSMDEAVRQAADVARPGDVVLLSPGGTSFDLYRDFEERGADFARAVHALPSPARRPVPLPASETGARRGGTA